MEDTKHMTYVDKLKNMKTSYKVILSVCATFLLISFILLALGEDPSLIGLIGSIIWLCFMVKIFVINKIEHKPHPK